MNLFYAPDISGPHHTLSPEESKHLLRVLRMNTGDAVMLTDGKGFFYDCRIEDNNPRACRLSVLDKKQGNDTQGQTVHMAVAPTKNIARYEWFLEKVTELGVGRVTPIICEHSERRQVKTERLERILVAAMKQSLKSTLPQLDPPESFKIFVKRPFNGEKFIAYISPDVTDELSKAYTKGSPALILIGPEGDFSPTEVELAVQNGFKPVRLGPSRLRTETAAVVACHTVNLLNL
ncbi:MAG: 16S rRNA (uracil(1498)-N(3))-methyltransferase [Chlorobi bacterium]|nr:16S rRNA (uracil(1498)-N(3))-methyltransferase [Chlorobiota bacterium]